MLQLDNFSETLGEFDLIQPESLNSIVGGYSRKKDTGMSSHKKDTSGSSDKKDTADMAGDNSDLADYFEESFE